MIVLLGTVFVASLLGSLHCVGMCGPFALLASTNTPGKTISFTPTIAYNLGRLLTYALVGAVFGLLGMAMNLGNQMAGWQQSATYIAGGLMILVGLIALARHLGITIRLPKVFSPVQRLLQTWFKRTKSMPVLSRALFIGALSTLMPCGWLYTFAITAAGTGSPYWGALLMISFWAGSVPIMVALMLGAGRMGASIQHRIPVVMATLVIVIGVFTIAYRAPITIGDDSAIVSGSSHVEPSSLTPTQLEQPILSTQQLIDQVNQIDHEKLPCCQGITEATQ